jgi:acyl-coenzyme A thioesterase PaaI-like protein
MIYLNAMSIDTSQTTSLGPEMLNPVGSLHGGCIATLVDVYALAHHANFNHLKL